MLAQRLWSLAHILLFVFWLGTDLAVLLLARAARRRGPSFAERTFALNAAAAIGLVPRVACALTFPVGLQALDAAYRPQPLWLLTSAWLLGASWTALQIIAARGVDGAAARRVANAQLAVQGALFALLVLLGCASLASNGPIPAGWAALKVLLLAVILVMGLGVEHAFRPVIGAFARLVKEGSKPEIEAPISAGIDAATRYVVGIYALLLVAAVLGAVRPL